MTGPLGPLERSLRDGPPDEAGYRPTAIQRPTEAPGLDGLRTSSLQRVVGRPSIRQAPTVAPWQFMAAVLVVAVGAGLVIYGAVSRDVPGASTPAGTSPSPSSGLATGSAAPAIVIPPLTETFTSPRNGFSVSYPAGWTVSPASVRWPANSFLPYGNPALDTLQGQDARLVVATQPLGEGQTAEEWLAAFFRPYEAQAPCSGEWTTWPQLDLGGEIAYLDAVGCPVPVDSRITERDVNFDAIVFSGGRVFEFGLDGDVDLAYFEALLRTVQLLPAEALD